MQIAQSGSEQAQRLAHALRQWQARFQSSIADLDELHTNFSDIVGNGDAES